MSGKHGKEAVAKLVEMGYAVGGEVADFSEFDRKNYFYPDIPKAYQISQYEFPFVKGGSLAGVALTRIHLEEDTARSLHDQGSGSIVDFNRAGVPLMELVTEPVIHDSETAVAFGKELQLLLRSLGISDAHMEKGEMRVEANISISDTDTFGTKVEVKNLNSFKAMGSAIAFEIDRQAKALENGEAIVQETRGWDENRERTFSQRSKETAEDYRYFSDPDIPKFKLANQDYFDKSRFSEKLQNTPNSKRAYYREHGVDAERVELIIGSLHAERFFRSVVEALGDTPHVIARAANYLTSDVFALMDANPKLTLSDASARHFAALMHMLENKEINSRVAKDILEEVLRDERDPQVLVTEKGLAQMSSEEELVPVVDAVLTEHAAVVDEYKGGKEASLQFLVGQCMKATKGSADPNALKALLIKRIG